MKFSATCTRGAASAPGVESKVGRGVPAEPPGFPGKVALPTARRARALARMRVAQGAERSVQSAGGVFADGQGGKPYRAHSTIAAATPELHAATLAALRS